MKFRNLDLGVALHTALRKCCDSAPTSAAWNLIYELKPEAWKSLLVAVHDGFKGFKYDSKKPKTELSRTDQLSVQLKSAVGHWEPWGHGHIAVALHCVFETFSDQDWYGFAEFLDHAVIKPTSKKKAKAKAAKA